MAVQFLVKGTHPDGSAGLVVISKEEWFKIIEQNYELPENEQRYFYRDVIVDDNKCDIIFMEVSKELLHTWDNAARKTRRMFEDKRKFTHVSLDELIEEGSQELIAPLSIEDTVFQKNFSECLHKTITNEESWMYDLLKLYLSGNEKLCVAHLMEKYTVGRSTAFNLKQQFETFVKNFFVNFWTF